MKNHRKIVSHFAYISFDRCARPSRPGGCRLPFIFELGQPIGMSCSGPAGGFRRARRMREFSSRIRTSIAAMSGRSRFQPLSDRNGSTPDPSILDVVPDFFEVRVEDASLAFLLQDE